MLVEDWRDWWRWWSMRLFAAGSAVVTYFVANPDTAFSVWYNLPEELKDSIPPHYLPLVGVVLLAAGMVARMLDQPKLDRKQQFFIGEKPPRKANDGDVLIIPSKQIIAQNRRGRWFKIKLINLLKGTRNEQKRIQRID